MQKIGLIHTTINSIGPSNAAFTKYDKKIKLLNFLDEGILEEIQQNNGINAKVTAKMVQLIKRAESCRVQGIMMNCSLFSPYVEVLQKECTVPVISADLAMLEYVVKKASDIAVIATVESAGPTTKRLLQQVAEKNNKHINVHVHIAEGAFTALNKGDEKTHNLIIQEIAKKLDEKHDVIVFAQISMARAINSEMNLKTEVVTSPSISAKTLIEKIKK